MIKKLVVDTMLKREGIVKLLFLLTAIFLFISDHNLRADPSPQTIDCDSHIVSTSYKRYSLYRYNEFYILCEPYTVQDGDWIYKLFRAKGELSQEDFGLFMRIFKNLNPHIKNTNTIKSGQRITIPLKKSKSNDFKESSPGVVELPTITLSQLTDASKPVKKPISSKSTLSSDAPFSDNASDNAKLNDLTAEVPVHQLKQYAALNNGQLMLKGKYYFPRDNQDDLVIDVSLNPLMQFNNGYKILFVQERDVFDEFVDTIKTFWHDFKIMEFKDLMSLSLYDEPLSIPNSKPLLSNQNYLETEFKPAEPLQDIYVPINMSLEQDHKSAVKQLLDITGYKYTPEKEFSLSVGNVKINVNLGIITKQAGSNVLVVFGDIYGSALESLKNVKQDHIVVTISPLLTSIEAAKKIFSAVGASTTDNPSFVNPNNGKTLLIEGVYVKNGENKLFISKKSALLKDAFNYLNDKHITVIRSYNSL